MLPYMSENHAFLRFCLVFTNLNSVFWIQQSAFRIHFYGIFYNRS